MIGLISAYSKAVLGGPARAAVIGVVMLAASFLLLLAINLLQRWARIRQGEM